MDNVLNIFFYLLLYSFIGWVLESIFKSFLEKQLVNSGFLKGPFCPIYGFGALIMLLTLNWLKGNIVLLFIISFFVLTIWEYIAGVVLEKVFKTKYWDYTDNFLNINGRVCLMNSIFWGILGVVFISYVNPFVEEKIALIPHDVLLYSTIIIYIFVVIDIIITTIKTIKIGDTVKKINELGDKIKLMLNKVKEHHKESKDEDEKAIAKLKEEQSKLKLNLYKTVKRLKLAFPTMKSETISNFLNEKIDKESLKKLIKNRGKNKE